MESVIGAFPSPLTSTDSLITGATSSCRVSRVDRGATCVTPGASSEPSHRLRQAERRSALGKRPAPSGGRLAARPAEPGARQHGQRGDPQGASKAPSAPGPRGGTPQPRAGTDTGRQSVGTLAHEAAALSLLSGFTFFLQIFFFSLNEIPLPIWTQPPLLSWARWKGERRGGILNLLWRV